MELRKVIEKRPTVSDFKNEDISTEILKYAIENAKILIQNDINISKRIYNERWR
jgi:hypothetical protein